MFYQNYLDYETECDIFENGFDDVSIQSGDAGFFSNMLEKAISKIAVFRGVKEEETQNVVDLVVNTFEAIPLTLQDLASARSGAQVMGALMRAFKMFTRMNILTAAFDAGKWILEALTNLTRESPEYTSIQGGEFSWVITGANQLLSNYQGVRNSALVNKLKTLLEYLLASGLMTSLGVTYKNLRFSDFESRQSKAGHSSVEGFVFSMLETTVWIIERSVQAVELGSFAPFLHNSENYVKWANKAQRICEDSLKMGAAPTLVCQIEHASDEERDACMDCKKFAELDEHTFTKRLQSAIDEGEMIEKFATGSSEKEPVKKMMRELRIIEAKFLSKDRAQRDRRPPFAMLVFGPTCVAKTMFMNILFSHYAKVHNKDPSVECMWTRNCLDKYYSGYKSSKWCIRLDDIAMFKPSGTLDPSMADVIMLQNGVNFIAPMASIEDKGVIPVRPELLLASTNQEDLNAHAYFSCPEAVRRRFPYVVSLTLKDDYKLKGTQMLDTSKIHVEPDSYQDIWKIELRRFRVTVNEETGVKTLETYTEDAWKDIDSFLAYYSRLTLEFKLHQMRAEKSAADMRCIDLCTSCYRSKLKCACGEDIVPYEEAEKDEEGYRLQGGEDNLPVYGNSKLEAIHDRKLAPKEYARQMQKYYTSVQGGDSDYDRVLTRMQEPLSQEEFAALLAKVRTCMEVTPREKDLISLKGQMEDMARERMQDDESDDSSDDEFSDSYENPFEADVEDWEEEHNSWVVKSLDWIDDSAMRARTRAWGIAHNVCSAIEPTVDKFMTAVSDLMILYQIKRFKRILQNAGESIHARCSKPLVGGFCALLLSAWTIWKTTSWFASQMLPQTDVQTCGTVPSFFEKDEKANPWIREEIILSEFQVPSKSRGWANLSCDIVKQKLLPNVVAIKTEYEDKDGLHHFPATAICVSGHIYMTNNHCIPTAEQKTVHLCQEPYTGNVGKNIVFTLSEKMVYRIPEKDIAFFWCLLPPKMDTSELFLKNPAPGMVCSGFYVHHKFGQFAETTDCAAIRNEQQMLPAPISAQMNCWSSTPQKLTVFGDCGSPLVGMTPLGPVILGIHQSLTGKRAASVQVLACDIANAVSFYGAQVQCGEPNLRDDIGSLHPKSVLFWPEEGQAHIYGSAPRGAFRNAPKSRVRPTFISEAAQEEGFERKHDKPVMKGPEVWYNNVVPTLTQNYLFDKAVLDVCVDQFSTDIIKSLDARQLSEMVKLDDKTTMNGYPGVKFLDKVNRQTSMGYPYRKSKQQFIVPCDECDEWADAVEYVDEVKDEIRLIREVYARGERYMPVFIMNLKDEPVTHAKIAIKKTRGFMGGPAAWQFVMRQHLLSFVRIFQLNSTIFEGAPGMNCNSCQWQHLREYLVQHGEDQMIAGDYAKFDKRMSPLFILAAFEVIISVLRAAGRSEEDLLAIMCIAHDVAYPLTDVQGDFVEFFGSNPSGHALTVIVNCIVNSLYMRYVYLSLNPDGEVASFKSNVSLMTYGDDNVQGVSKQVPWFNHTTISNFLAKYDVQYTMADKESESVPYIHISEVSFLKRRFVDVEGRIACPLEWDSIEKMLTSCVASRSVVPEEQAIQSIRSAIGEFFQYGRKTFEENVQKMRRIVKKCNLEDYVQLSTFPSYDDLLIAYIEAGRGCRQCSPCLA